MNGPFLLLRATLAFANLGMRLWTALLGRRGARVLLFGGMAVSATVAVFLQVTR